MHDSNMKTQGITVNRALFERSHSHSCLLEVRKTSPPYQCQKNSTHNQIPIWTIAFNFRHTPKFSLFAVVVVVSCFSCRASWAKSLALGAAASERADMPLIPESLRFTDDLSFPVRALLLSVSPATTPAHP
jgi:hypothetical protein